MKSDGRPIGFHNFRDADLARSSALQPQNSKVTYTFENFFHPLVGELIRQVNHRSLAEMLDPVFLDALDTSSDADNEPPNTFFKLFKTFYSVPQREDPNDKLGIVEGFPKLIDVREGSPYANYNWELLFHIPLTIAVHLSKNQRFAEAQRWFHYIFNPTSNDTSIDPPERFWNFLAFRGGDVTQIEELLALLSKPDNECNEHERTLKQNLLAGYEAIKDKPFQPHKVARTRHLAYQYSVVMKYLDNLIAWGDSLFRQDTIESINEATLRYVLAANILGPRPQPIPPQGAVRAKTFAELKAQGTDAMGNALVELEGTFPFNFGLPQTQNPNPSAAQPLFGIARTFYFCIPRNDKLLGYWDTVADRLFKIRHCMNIEGVVRQLALFEPPIDPGMLVKAAAAGIDVGSIVSGLNQPVGPIRSVFLMQKALELASEVRGLGNALLSVIEKSDGEHLALLRQEHEIKIQQMQREVRFLQWKQTQEATESLIRSRVSALERYEYYGRLLGLVSDNNTVPQGIVLDRSELTEETFDEFYGTLVGHYDRNIPVAEYPTRTFKDEGTLRLLAGEFDELNEHAENAVQNREKAIRSEQITAALVMLPGFGVNTSFMGVGPKADISGGDFFSAAGRAVSAHYNLWAQDHEAKGQRASKTASYERRADEWMLQRNLAGLELMQIGKQIIGSLIAEQIAHHEYLNIQKQIEQSEEVDRFLHEKFTNEELYLWMQGELARLYYEYYRFAFDTARKAEQTMKRELMRPETDATEYVKPNYWNAGRKGLLSGESLYLDLKRMEMAYHENNKREYELTKHVSLRQLKPLALLDLKATGTCEVNVPEWLFDLDNPGHYLRRIKNVSLSIPSVAGPYTSVSCTLSLLKSSLRKTTLGDDYERRPSEDDRFVDYYGTIQSIVTSTGNNDSGLFETNLRDERFLPFEGAGAESTWKLELPGNFRQFDYDTISDVVLHLRYTARQGGAPLRDKAVAHLKELMEEANDAGLTLLFSLKHDFPTELHRYNSGNEDFVAKIKRDYFPYFTQLRNIEFAAIQLWTIKDNQPEPGSAVTESDLIAYKELLNHPDKAVFDLTFTPAQMTGADKNAFVVIRYSIKPNS